MAKLEICSKCRFERESEYGCRCSKCITSSDFTEFVPKTNADRIRAMSDEELAELLAKFTTICEMCIHLNENCMTMADDRCREGILQWLKSEAKE